MMYTDRTKVKTTLPIFEESGIELPLTNLQMLHVYSHKNKCKLVTLDLDGKTFSVNGEQLAKAIQNALNS